MIARTFALIAGLATLVVAGPALTAEPNPLVASEGVGGCMWRGLSADLQKAALLSYLVHGTSEIGDIPGIREAIATQGVRCTGRPADNGPHDRLEKAAFMGALMRVGSLLALHKEAPDAVAHLDDVWRAASHDEREPIMQVAAVFFGGPKPVIDQKAMAAPFLKHLKADASNPAVFAQVYFYYVGTIVWLQAERGLKPPT